MKKRMIKMGERDTMMIRWISWRIYVSNKRFKRQTAPTRRGYGIIRERAPLPFFIRKVH